jgi:pyruvate,water dikinase
MAGERAQWALIQAAMSSSEIADCIRRNPPAQALERLSDLPSARRWLQDLLLYCRVYGHATACHDYLYPTQADDPAKAIAAIRTRLEMPAGDPAKRQAQVAAEREKATEMALSKLSGSPLRKALFRWALAWAQEGAAIREDVFFHAFQGWPMARRAILEFGNRLVSAGALHASEGIFFLRWEEIKQAAGPQIPKDFRATVAERRKEHEWQSALTPPHWVPLGGPPLTLGRKVKIKIKRFLLGRREKQDGRLHGSPVSPGVVSGRARVIRSTSEFGMLRRGEILIAPAATPEWMPAFAVAAGLVTDTGGPLSHSSIIVREFGIPAVMGVQTATQSIADGQWITLDGGEGVIQLHQKSLAAP